MRKILSLVVLFAITTVATDASAQCPPAESDPAVVRYAAPEGRGNGLTAESPFRVQDFWKTAQAGWTLCLASGTYTASNGGLLHPPAGRSGNESQPITIGALNESNPPLFDGEWENEAISLGSQNSYWVIQGINAKNGKRSIVRISDGSNHNIIRRVIAWDVVWNGNNEIFGVHYGASHNLLEDIAAFGVARKMVNNTQGGEYTTYRRVWSWHHGSGDQGPSMVEIAYNSSNNLFENVLSTVNHTYGPETYTFTSNGNDLGLGENGGNYRTRAPGALLGYASVDTGEGVCANTRIYSGLAYIKQTDVLHVEHEDGYGWYLVRDNGLVDCTTWHHIMAITQPNHKYFNSWRGLVFQDVDHTYGATGQGRSAQYITSVASWNSIDPIVGLGSTLATGSSISAVPSPWTATSVGANLCYRYIDGVRTNVPLWPWPMNERIKQATAMAGVYDGPCLNCSGGRAPRIAIDVTADVELLLGRIPDQCRP